MSSVIDIGGGSFPRHGKGYRKRAPAGIGGKTHQDGPPVGPFRLRSGDGAETRAKRAADEGTEDKRLRGVLGTQANAEPLAGPGLLERCRSEETAEESPDREPNRRAGTSFYGFPCCLEDKFAGGHGFFGTLW